MVGLIFVSPASARRMEPIVRIAGSAFPPQEEWCKGENETEGPCSPDGAVRRNPEAVVNGPNDPGFRSAPSGLRDVPPLRGGGNAYPAVTRIGCTGSCDGSAGFRVRAMHQFQESPCIAIRSEERRVG